MPSFLGLPDPCFDEHVSIQHASHSSWAKHRTKTEIAMLSYVIYVVFFQYHIKLTCACVIVKYLGSLILGSFESHSRLDESGFQGASVSFFTSGLEYIFTMLVFIRNSVSSRLHLHRIETWFPLCQASSSDQLINTWAHRPTPPQHALT